MKLRCINLDWLEVYAFEPINQPHDESYFRQRGYKVKVRAYGTPQYREMFTLIADGHELFEIRRNPYSIKRDGGIFPENACHIRLCNRTCYEIDPVNHLRAFMLSHDYTYKAISRIDIALDFNEFDNGEDPAKFINKYMRGKIAKVNQSNVSAHGTDEWSRRVFNSLKWGSPSSPVSTKLYNKTLELKQGEDKPYIRQAWSDAGLDVSRDVWRVEFSLTAQMQTLKSLKTGEMFKKSIIHYDSRERLLKQFYILAQKYLDFRKCLVNRKSDGTLVYVRKYLCPKIELFRYNIEATPYTPCRNVTQRKRPDRIYKILINRIAQLYDDPKATKEHIKGAQAVVNWLVYKMQLEVGSIKDRWFLDAIEVNQCKWRQENEPQEFYEEYQKDYELRVLHHLMLKYGIVAIPDEAPF